jgi:hypothetical protein
MGRRLFRDTPHSSLARDLNDLGSVYVATGRHAAGLSLLEQSLAMEQALRPGEDCVDTAISMINVGSMYTLQGRAGADKALAYVKPGVAMMQRVCSREHNVAYKEALWSGYMALFMVYQQMGRTMEAMQAMQAAQSLQASRT